MEHVEPSISRPQDMWPTTRREPTSSRTSNIVARKTKKRTRFTMFGFSNSITSLTMSEHALGFVGERVWLLWQSHVHEAGLVLSIHPGRLLRSWKFVTIVSRNHRDTFVTRSLVYSSSQVSARLMHLTNLFSSASWTFRSATCIQGVTREF